MTTTLFTLPQLLAFAATERARAINLRNIATARIQESERVWQRVHRGASVIIDRWNAMEARAAPPVPETIGAR